MNEKLFRRSAIKLSLNCLNDDELEQFADASRDGLDARTLPFHEKLNGLLDSDGTINEDVKDILEAKVFQLSNPNVLPFQASTRVSFNVSERIARLTPEERAEHNRLKKVILQNLTLVE